MGLAHVRAPAARAGVALNARAKGGASARRFVVTLLLLSAWLAPRTSAAHDTAYSYADLDWRRDRIVVALSVHRDDAAVALGLAVPESLMRAPFLAREAPRLGRLLATGLHVRADGHDLALRLDSAKPVPARHAVQLAFSAASTGPGARLAVNTRLFPANAQHETFVNVYSAGRLLRQAVLTAGAPAVELYGRGAAGLLAVIGTFLLAGINHIFIGPDHILFIVGLLLLGGGLGRVLKVVTAFTAAHSVTLALAATGAVSMPARVVEPLIALSIVTIGIENLRHRPGAPDRRAALAFGFGLVHGLGFASVLRELGLPHEALGWSLLAFNLGVETGQACIVVAVTPLLAVSHSARPRAAWRVVAVGSCAIVAAGGYWFVQRILMHS